MEDGSSHKSFASADSQLALAAADLSKTYRDARGRRTALDGISFTVRDGETFVVLGPSGAGKTTLLRIIAGLERPERGELQIGGCDALPLPPQRRAVALVFQEDALFPHLTIYENLAFALKLRRRRSRAQIESRVRGVAASLQIESHLRERPNRLSGGERQRAAIARAVLSEPRVLLLDEPLAHLDPQLRAHVRALFAQFRRTFTGAAVYVTHDHLEALGIADRLAILIDGRIAQQGTPQAVYDAPANIRVAAFFGSPAMNLLDGGDEIVGIRPEHIRIDGQGTLRGQIIAREPAGSDAYVRASTPRGEVLARISASYESALPGDHVSLTLPEAHVHRFDRVTGERIA